MYTGYRATEHLVWVHNRKKLDVIPAPTILDRPFNLKHKRLLKDFVI